MKASRSKAKLAKPARPAAAAKAPRRKRQTGVRRRILKILGAGAVTGPELLKKGRFSPAALYLNLKALRDEGLIDSQRTGRSVVLRLKHGSKAEEEPIEGVVVSDHQPKAKPRASSALVPALIPQELHEALSAVTFRLSPVQRVEEKLVVLEQLARNMPAAVSDVLRSVMEDVAKLSTLKPQAEQ